jgi:hypothetical protein
MADSSIFIVIVLEHRRRVDPVLAKVVEIGESALLDRTR